MIIIGLFGKTINHDSLQYLQQLIEVVESQDMHLVIFEPFYHSINQSIRFDKDPETFKDFTDIYNRINFLISVGGDGTLLDTITLVRNSGIPILGVNMGKMGFLSSVAKENLVPAINALANGTYSIDQRTMLKLMEPGVFGDLNFALNELSVFKKDPHSMIIINVFIDGNFLNSYWADGLIIATPTGSTAYSLSCGGPIITPGSENFIITPIATHNLTVRPIVIPDKSLIKIIVECRQREYFISLDSRFRTIDSSAELIIMKENFNINLVRLENEVFFKTIREKLKWGIDIRN
jgi:NAD+ kinase